MVMTLFLVAHIMVKYSDDADLVEREEQEGLVEPGERVMQGHHGRHGQDRDFTWYSPHFVRDSEVT